MTGDIVSPAERLSPSLWRRKLGNFIQEVWVRYNLKCARWELEKFDQARKHDIAGQWRGLVVKLSDQLKALGVDPDKEPQDLTRTLEVYLVVGCVIGCLLAGLMLSLYRSALKDLLGG